MPSTQKIIYTIGHSIRTQEEFISILQSFKIELLADIRSYPGSKRYPHFNKENLQKILPGYKIIYQHFSELGGRRKTSTDSKNTAWKNDAFRGYADYMGTEDFKKGISKLEDAALKNKTAYMCSEAVWWRCHRSMVSDYLKWKGWKVLHIMAENKSEEHPYTSPAKIVDGQLSYSKDQQTLF
ncbi:MAG TPA: DUF488 domain-containing protein [Chitinophagaceae bacterium]